MKLIIDFTEFFAKEDDITWTPLLLIIPLRLGLSECNNIYIDNIKVLNNYCKYLSL